MSRQTITDDMIASISRDIIRRLDLPESDPLYVSSQELQNISNLTIDSRFYREIQKRKSPTEKACENNCKCFCHIRDGLTICPDCESVHTRTTPLASPFICSVCRAAVFQRDAVPDLISRDHWKHTASHLPLCEGAFPLSVEEKWNPAKMYVKDCDCGQCPFCKEKEEAYLDFQSRSSEGR